MNPQIRELVFHTIHTNSGEEFLGRANNVVYLWVPANIHVYIYTNIYVYEYIYKNMYHHIPRTCTYIIIKMIIIILILILILILLQINNNNHDHHQKNYLHIFWASFYLLRTPPHSSTKSLQGKRFFPRGQGAIASPCFDSIRRGVGFEGTEGQADILHTDLPGSHVRGWTERIWWDPNWTVGKICLLDGCSATR